ncbi:LysE/ArgO family amino acid transporter [Cellulomonas sp. HZM]|uniref:LysE/ArgO family amino acid transporter n=1 Tax=Cellulomonas sp. HZM TaxID=1454010 RepID=UPI0004936BA0|nr:LysE family transporter [Cellulomonas sp. HZM]
MLSSLVAGFLTSLGLIVVIGAQNAFVLRQGVRREHVGVVVAICAASDAVLMAVGVGGLGAVLEHAPAVVTVTRWAGAAYLLVLAVAAARRASRAERLVPAEGVGASLRTVVLTLAGVTFLNPHVYLDTVVLVGSLAHQHPAAWGFWAGAAAASATWFTALGFGATRLAPLFARPVSWRVLDGFVALVMLAAAVSLVAA